MNDTAAQVALRTDALLGEGPVWDAQDNRLIWVNILDCAVHRFDPATGDNATLTLEQHVGAAHPHADGGLVVNVRDGIGRVDTEGFSWLLHDPVPGRRGNEAAVDPRGHLWAGTMRYDEAEGGGTLVRHAPSGESITVLDDVTISNGTDWSPDGTLMYYADTPTRRVDVFDVDPDTGLIHDRRPFVQLPHSAPAQPDGLTVDADGCVWVALWKGAAVHRYTPRGELDRVLRVPADQVSSCTFGGPGLTDLYITTATVGLDDQQRAEQPLAGSLFVVPGAGVGRPGHRFAA